jgi:Na+/H+ antiporter NhaA
LTYGIIFWGNTPHSNVIFRIKKRIVRIMVGVRNTDSCIEYFKRLKKIANTISILIITPVFVSENIDHFRLNLEIHGFKSKNKSNLHLPP